MNRILSYILLSVCFLFVLIDQVDAQKFTLVIDAGHGGKDPGARGRIINEKTINLNVALKFGALVSKHYNDVNVIYTRKSDKFIELNERADIANRNKADLFISIHTNSVAKGKSSVKGTETYTLGLARTEENLDVAKRENSVILLEDDYKIKYEGFDPNSTESYIIFEFMQNKHMEQSVALASKIQEMFTSERRENRGVRQAGFLVLRKTSMPSVLIEVGFISNREEENYMATEKGQMQLAKAIFNAFANYKKSYSARLGKSDNKILEIKDVEVDESKVVRQKEFSNDPPAGSEEDILLKKKKRYIDSKQTEETPLNVRIDNSVSKKKDSKGKVIYKIQVLTSIDKLSPNSKLLKGYKNVESVRGNRFYRYFYGESENYNEILKLWRNVVKDFKDSYIVSFKDGEMIN